MARSDQLKALFRAYGGEDDAHFFSVAMQMVADEASRGHTRLADELRALLERAKTRTSREPSRLRPIPLAQPKGMLGELLTVQYPQHHLGEMVLSLSLLQKLDRVLTEQRHQGRLQEFGLVPRRKLLLVGAPGTGKTMTASALAGELRLPLFTARFDSLITKFMGESASKLRLIFDALKTTRGVYFFDEFDSLGLQRGSQHDVAEMRRTLNMFLQLIEQDDSQSLIIAATNHGADLDVALFRRFDDIVRYELPTRGEVEALLRQRLGFFAPPVFDYESLAAQGLGQSQADIARACTDAVKDAVLANEEKVSEPLVHRHLQEQRNY